MSEENLVGLAVVATGLIIISLITVGFFWGTQEESKWKYCVGQTALGCLTSVFPIVFWTIIIFKYVLGTFPLTSAGVSPQGAASADALGVFITTAMLFAALGCFRNAWKARKIWPPKRSDW